MVGGDNRYQNTQYFKGIIYSLSLFSDVRTAEEVRRDSALVIATGESLLYTEIYLVESCNPYSAGVAHVESAWIVDREPMDGVNGLCHKECLACGSLISIKEVSNTREETVVAYPDGTGMEFSSTADAVALDPFAASPKTFEVLLQLNPKYDQRAGVLLGSYDGGNANGLNVEIYTNGQFRLYYKVGMVGYSYIFTPDIRSEGLTHLALTIDGLTASLYINGKFAQAITLDVMAPEITEGFYLGNDKRTTGDQYFKGTIYSVALFDDVRTAEEIALDAITVASDAEGVLYLERFVSQN